MSKRRLDDEYGLLCENMNVVGLVCAGIWPRLFVEAEGEPIMRSLGGLTHNLNEAFVLARGGVSCAG